jgi:hypothetical protein
MSIKIPYVRKKISTLLTLSAIAMLLGSLLLLFNLQAVQASSSSSNPISYRTTADGAALCRNPTSTVELKLTFDAQGYYNSGAQEGSVTNGTFQMTNISGNVLYSGHFDNGDFDNSSSGGNLVIRAITFDHAPDRCSTTGATLTITTSCSTSNENIIDFVPHSLLGNPFTHFQGPVECSLIGGGADSNRDSDGDGKPDSSDRCPNNSHHRCFKEAA